MRCRAEEHSAQRIASIAGSGSLPQGGSCFSVCRRKSEPENGMPAEGDEIAVAERAGGAVVEPGAVDGITRGVEAPLDQERAAAQRHPAVGAADAGRLIPDDEVLIRASPNRDPPP